ncbi:MAG: hypothetical protein HQL81_05665 [Magnetococcales bacterium]|nr:hypothetical protein [Magnetococcales bacterium]
MSDQRVSLDGIRVGLSISDSPDLIRLGLDKEHVHDAVITLATALLAKGGEIAYGGDLRPQGFTRTLIRSAQMYNDTRQAGDSRSFAKIFSYLAGVVRQNWTASDRVKCRREFEGAVAIIDDFPAPGNPDLVDPWPASLTSMRERITDDCRAYVFMGGQVTNFKGALPGIAEEALLMLKKKKPIYLVGGFGGCTSDLIKSIWGLKPPVDLDREAAKNDSRYLKALEQIAPFRDHFPNNGLTLEENHALAAMDDSNQFLPMILRGISKACQTKKNIERKKGA